jgi:hypothetical protein
LFSPFHYSCPIFTATPYEWRSSLKYLLSCMKSSICSGKRMRECSLPYFHQCPLAFFLIESSHSLKNCPAILFLSAFDWIRPPGQFRDYQVSFLSGFSDTYCQRFYCPNGPSCNSNTLIFQGKLLWYDRGWSISGLLTWGFLVSSCGGYWTWFANGRYFGSSC